MHIRIRGGDLDVIFIVRMLTKKVKRFLKLKIFI